MLYWNERADNSVSYEMHNGCYPRLQFLTVASLFGKRRPEIPLIDPAAFRKAQREDLSRNRQENLL
jgi:hypothetical protein